MLRLAQAAAPDRGSESGYRWALCRTCGWSADRDASAAARIVSRGLASQMSALRRGPKKTRRTKTGTLVLAQHTDAVVTRARRPKRSTHVSPPVPSRRRRVPTPVLTLSAGQRPVGRRAQGSVGPAQLPTTAPCRVARARPRPRGALLGRGFHLGVHATALKWGRWPGRGDHAAAQVRIGC